ncbi:MAG: putative efflux protein family [Clostridia bacterium]|nr:putative efflux protein family [Clostridia bacterium]
MCITASLRGVGLTKLPMLYNLIANGTNVFLNYILIYGKFGFPEMGVRGAAIATTLSKLIAFIISIIIIFFKDSPVRIKITDDFRLKVSVLKRILDVGVTASLEQFAMQVGFIFFTKTVSVLSIPVFAAHQIGLNINGLCWVPSQAFGVAATTLVGQSIGAGNKDKAKIYAKFIHKSALVCSLFIAVIFLFWSENIASLYSDEPEVIKTAGEVLKLVALGMPSIATQLPISAALRGAKDTRFPLIASISGIWIFRVIVAPIFVHVFHWGIHGAWWTIVLDQTCRAVVVYIRFIRGKWLNKKVST